MREERGRKGKERGKGLESHLEQRCCLSPWVSTANSTEGNYVITNRMLSPCQDPRRCPLSGASLCSEVWLPGLSCYHRKDDQLDSVFEKGWGEEWIRERAYANLQISSKPRLHFRNVGYEKKKRDCFAAKGSLPLYSGNYRLPLCQFQKRSGWPSETSHPAC